MTSFHSLTLTVGVCVFVYAVESETCPRESSDRRNRYNNAKFVFNCEMVIVCVFSVWLCIQTVRIWMVVFQ